jgi:hypothetical protein
MRFTKVTTLLAGAALLALAGAAEAQVTKDDAKCRATVQKNTGKLTATASKAIVGCWKSVLGGKISYTACNDSATADTKGKISKASGKLTDAVGGAKTKCDDTTHAAALAEFADCPSPGTEGTGMTTFTQVGNCLATIGQVMADNMHRSAMNPSASQVLAIQNDTDAKQLIKCGNSIQKNFSKLMATVGKTEGGYQAKTLDKAAGSYDYGAAGQDPKGKIAKAAAKLDAAIVKDCGPLSETSFGYLNTCGRSALDVGACLDKTARLGSGGVTQVSFDMPGLCPATAYALLKPGQTNSSSPGAGDGATTTVSQIDAGWVGFGHDNDFVSFEAGAELTCSDNTCSECIPVIACLTGNCRCTNDPTIECDEPLVADADDCGGAICRVFNGPPLPAVVSSTPTCIVAELNSPITGTADTGDGSTDISLDTKAQVYLGITQSQPCPTCTAGFCVGGNRDTLACSGNNGINPTFGGTSLDCPPDLLSNISGSGLQIALGLATAPSSLDANIPCTAVGVLDCPCAVCSGDTTIPCNADSACSDVGAGTCTSVGPSGAQTLPNSCSDGVCTVDAGTAEGTCDAVGSAQNYCDGFTNSNGSGMITCSTNGDCGAVSAGNCTLTEQRKCFGNSGDSIDVIGVFPGQNNAVMGGTFCFPPTANAGINGAGGSPGPGRARVAFDITAKCLDGVTDFRLGGANCP